MDSSKNAHAQQVWFITGDAFLWLSGGLNHGNRWKFYNIVKPVGYLLEQWFPQLQHNICLTPECRKRESFWKIRGGRVAAQPHACPQKISGGVHLAALGTGLGLEPELVRGTVPWAPDAHAPSSLDASQSAEKLGGKIHAAAQSLVQTALLWQEDSARVVKKKWDKSAKTLPGLRLVGVLECAFVDSCKKTIWSVLNSSAYVASQNNKSSYSCL